MPVQRRNVLEVDSFPWIDAIKIECVDEHRVETRLWLSIEQAKTLRHRLDDVLEPIQRFHGPFGCILELYDVRGGKHTMLVTNAGMFPAEG